MRPVPGGRGFLGDTEPRVDIAGPVAIAWLAESGGRINSRARAIAVRPPCSREALAGAADSDAVVAVGELALEEEAMANTAGIPEAADAVAIAWLKNAMDLGVAGLDLAAIAGEGGETEAGACVPVADAVASAVKKVAGTEAREGCGLRLAAIGGGHGGAGGGGGDGRRCGANERPRQAEQQQQQQQRERHGAEPWPGRCCHPLLLLNFCASAGTCTR